MTHSLRGRLLIGLTFMILVTGIGAGAFGYRWAYDEAIEEQDRTLTHIAAFVLQTRFPVGKSVSSGAGDRTRIIIDELGSTPDQGHRSRVLAPFGEGLHVITIDNEPWRVLIRIRPDESRIAVRQTTAVRDGIARESALYTILPFVAVMPFLVLVLVVVVMRSLRPIADLAGHLDARRSDDLEKLSLEGTPDELHPFISSINRLLERVRMLIEQQRRFVADASHELRTPITALSLQAENLENIQMSDDGRERLTKLQDGARRTKRLLDQLLTLARYESGQASALAVTSLDQCAKEVVADLLPKAADRAIDLGFSECEAILVQGHPIALATVLRNLVDNALRFTPCGGRIDISVRREGQIALVEVSDTGPGILSADLGVVFDPFVRGSRPNGEGTGLGLSIVKRIVEGIGGTVVLQNANGEQGRGCQAVVRLPAA
ncbi:ATP-binding protein [Tardiphaga sp.]|uniref:sensor histidine kinase n=1 Tax=Tardiphaga sp. TaxID=1926292 RepID=UPI00263761E8|nr:ATP-binding protein [Tardiphaga sp.]MDB5615964.1 histidine kinase [Tardiphaga sp.]